MTPPPDTDLKRQSRRHIGPLLGMAVLVGIVLLGFLWWVANSADPADTGEEQVEERITE